MFFTKRIKGRPFFTAQEIKISIQDFFRNFDQPNEEILNEKFYFSCSV